MSLTHTYGYDTQGQLTSITYPSGLIVGYGWSGGRITSVSVNGSAFITGITYRPMSSMVFGWSWAAGGTYQKTFDANGRVSGVIDTGVINQATTFDAALRLTSVTDYGLSLSTGYTAGDQLSSINVNGSTQTFTIDSNWNRTAKKHFNNTTDSTPIAFGTNVNSGNTTFGTREKLRMGTRYA